MRTLVTGAAGFIGSHLVKSLLQDGHSVVAMDRFGENKENYTGYYSNHPRIKPVKADLSRRNEVKISYFKNIDWVFHFGAVSRIEESFHKPEYYQKVNVTGTFNVINAAIKTKVKKFIYASSASVYGTPDFAPTSEIAGIKLESPYALSKFSGEQLVLHFGKVYKIPVVSVRMVSVYGPKLTIGGTYGSILTLFMNQKEAGKPFTVVGDGRQRRDLVYVSDVCQAIITLAESDAKNEIFNIGGGKTYSILEIVKLLGGNITYLPRRPWEGSFKQVDITKIQKMIGWKPKFDLKEGIAGILLQNSGI